MPALMSEHPWEVDKFKWKKCLEEVNHQMIKDGWNEKARKFMEVKLRKARKLFYKS